VGVPEAAVLEDPAAHLEAEAPVVRAAVVPGVAVPAVQAVRVMAARPEAAAPVARAVAVPGAGDRAGVPVPEAVVPAVPVGDSVHPDNAGIPDAVSCLGLCRHLSHPEPLDKIYNGKKDL